MINCECNFEMSTVDSTGTRLYKMDTSAKRIPTVGPYLSLLSALSKPDTFRTCTKCPPSQRDVPLIEKQIEGVKKGRDQLAVGVRLIEVSVKIESTVLPALFVSLETNISPNTDTKYRFQRCPAQRQSDCKTKPGFNALAEVYSKHQEKIRMN